MTKAKLLAFLLCDRATRGSDGKVTVHDIFDRIVLPQIPVHYGDRKLFCVFYKVEALEPCVISLRVVDRQGNEVPVQGGPRHDSIEQTGLMQSLWYLVTDMFQGVGDYRFELRVEGEGSDVQPLATSILKIDLRKD
ncbi:MAG: DUF6941 family protein [Terriglobia bacterium]